MSAADCKRDDAPMAARASSGTRIDAAHVLTSDKEGGRAASDRSAPDPCSRSSESGESGSAAQQIRTQAAQLSEYLRDGQKRLDHRQSQLCAQIAQMENDARTGRLLLKERAAELETRQTELDRKDRELEAQRADLAAAEAAAARDRKEAEDGLARREQSIRQREGQLDRTAEQQREKTEAELAARENAIRHRQRELEATLASSQKAQEAFQQQRQRAEEALRDQRRKIDLRRNASLQLVRLLLCGVRRRRREAELQAAELLGASCQPGPELLLREEQVREAAQALEARDRQIKQAEADLDEARAELDRLGERLLADRRKVQEQARTERQRMAAEHHRVLAELDEKRQSLARRSEHVDQCRAALEQLREELGQMHRETLEIRLATEELWVQLSGSSPPAALTRSLGQIRAKLAKGYQQVGEELTERKQELEALRSQVAEEHGRLVRAKEDWERWAARRQEEIDQQAQRLLAREQVLDRQETVFNDLARKWQAEQLGYQQEIRRLKAQVGQPEAVPA